MRPEKVLCGNCGVLIRKGVWMGVEGYSYIDDNQKRVCPDGKRHKPKPENDRCQGGCCDNGTGFCMHCGYKLP